VLYGWQPGISSLMLPCWLCWPAYGSAGNGRGRAAILPNGSAGIGGPPQVLQSDHYVEHAFQLAVEVALVAAEPLQPARSSASPSAWAQMSGQFASPT
jgi:hypothetical protein